MFTLLQIRYRYALLIFSFSSVIFFLVACKPPIEKTTASTNNDFSGIYSQSEQILFLTFKIKNDTILKKASEFSLANKLITDGKIKMHTNEISIDTAYPYIGLSFLTEQNKIIYTHLLKHPIYKDFEYINEEGNFQMSSLKLYETELFVRIPYNISIKKVNITEKNEFGTFTIKNIAL